MKKVAFVKCILVSFFVLISVLALAQQTFRTTSSGSIIGYLEYLPADYHNNSDKYPVLIFLHGADERGANSTDPAVLQTTISLVSKLGPPMHVKNGAQFPFILISPQLKTSYGSWPASYVKEVIDHCKTYLRIDERRIHVTGLSMGGHGTWTCIESMPSLYASAAPVCGANNSPSKACGIASENVAVWAFHGDKDPVVSYTKTTNMVNAINNCSPAPSPLAKATIYANVQHNAWYRAYFLDNNYHTPNFYQWIMLQTRLKRGGNNIPQANAGSDRTIALPTTSLSLTGSGTDNGGSIASYSWSQLQGPSKATFNNPSSATVTASGLVSGTYVFKLTVTDNGGLIDSDFVKVSVTGTGNTPPVVSAGVDKVVTLPTNSTTINGTATDPGGSIASYSWTKVSGGAATLSGQTTANLSVSGMVAGTYIFRLTATDNSGASSFDDVNVVVNNAPTVSAGADVTITLPTNSASAQATASDSDGSIASYAWTKLSGGAATLSGASTSRLTASGLVEGTYVFRVTATDNLGASKVDDVQIIVRASSGSNTAPVAAAGADRIITLPTSSLSISGSGTDADGTIAAYSWTKLSGGAATMSGATTQTLNLSGLAAGSYIFRLTVTDNGGATGIDDVSVTVNNAPTVSAGPDVAITLPTNSAAAQATANDPDGTISSYSWAKLAGGSASISGANTSRMTASGLVEGTYVFRVTVIDNLGASRIDDMQITVGPSSATNAAPVSNAGADRVITLPTSSVSLPGSGTDADGTITAYSWKQLAGGAVTMSGGATSTLNVSNMAEGTYGFRLTVTDDDGATGIDDVWVTVNPGTNNEPVANAGADRAITLPTSSVSLPGSGTDSDGTITAYSWKQLAGGAVTMSGGATSTLNVSNMAAGTYGFRLTVTDDDGATDIDDVWVTVNAATNSDPVADAGVDRVISLPTSSIGLTGSGTDADGTIVSYSWRQLLGGAVTMSGAATQTLNLSNMAAGNYLFRLTVTDNTGATDIDDVAVTVNNPPSVSAGADVYLKLPTNYATLQATASDTDGTIESYTWMKLAGGTVVMTGTSAATMTVSGLGEGSYGFRVTVRDNHGATRIDDVWVEVEATTNVVPVALAGADQVISLPQTSISLTGGGTDSDGTIVSYSWRKLLGGAVTMTGTSSQTLTLSDLAAGSYLFRLTVTDNAGATDIDDVAVTVNTPPDVYVGKDITLTLPANSTSVTGIVSDPDGSIASYSWRKLLGGAATLSNADTQTLTLTGLVESTYIFRLTVTDNHGASSIDDVMITVTSATSGASILADREVLKADGENSDPAFDLDYDNNDYWKNKKVVLYDGNGRQMFTGQWSSAEYTSLIEPGKLYIFNVLETGKPVRQGKLMVIR